LITPDSRPVFVFLNGAFGIGKTSVAGALRRRLPRAVILNPEYIGYLLQRLPARTLDDFQDSPAWRSLTIAAARTLGRFRPIVIIPMAFTNVEYLDQLRSALSQSGTVFHFCLVAPLSTVQARLAARGEPVSDPRRAWVHRRAAECCAVHAGRAFGIQVEATDRAPSEIAAEIAGQVQRTADASS
jgi:chloramphenicol 3-O-phosphotransferase